ncbi:methyl-accepting chemotaxis protein [Marinobacter sp. BSs20148]|jgi:methyl-accepting chemotaxis protein|uniref:HAMP domain-containing methyl-accepting chemotaxis protein n=1 Tax=Marinobacter sp. BSs20148 TaxID=490759 RepID=UPI0002776B5E|nr:methyl-accepting chemotaxis protein [Marinobacter sp. BSs20148]AFP29841.1 Hemolysin secretion protein [Marinobacter sp. BSs20148]
MPFSNMFSNWSIGGKLAAGITLLILLSVVIGAIGLFTLHNYGERSLVVADVGSAESALLEARTAEKNYLLRKKDQYLEQVTTLTNAASLQMEDLKTRLVAQADIDRLNAMQAGIQQYQQNLSALANTINQRSEAIQTLEKSSRLVESRLSTEKLLFEAENMVKQMRRQERRFLVENNADAADRFIKMGSMALELVRNSYAAVNIKEEVERLFQDYIEAFDVALASTLTAQELENSMVKGAGATISDAVILQELQLELMVSERQQAVTLIVVAMFSVLVLGAFSGWLLTRSITRPIREAVSLATRVASGDLSADIRSDRGDEFGQLLSALGAMVVNLRDLVRSINTNSGLISTSANQLSLVTERTSSGIAQQRDQTDQVATAMNEMVATANDVATNAGAAFTAANLANQKAAAGEAAVNETLSHVTELNDKVLEVTQRLQGLQADTQNIVSVLDVIKSVADQTNLLALNAAIEAARAGEQGRGFAVVADEVRSLAKRTQTSATEIEGLVNSLVNSAERSVVTMRQGSELAQRTLEKAQSTGEQIMEITRAVEDISRLNSQIATAAEQQTAVAEDINQNVTLIRDVSEQSANDSTEVAAASHELARFGEGLQTQVERFRMG